MSVGLFLSCSGPQFIAHALSLILVRFSGRLRFSILRCSKILSDIFSSNCNLYLTLAYRQLHLLSCPLKTKESLGESKLYGFVCAPKSASNNSAKMAWLWVYLGWGSPFRPILIDLWPALEKIGVRTKLLPDFHFYVDFDSSIKQSTIHLNEHNPLKES